MERMKIATIGVLSALMSWLGVLAVPVFMLVGCNVLDYITGLLASSYRNEVISSYKGMKGIIKKVCMWVLVLIGAWVDILLNFALDCGGLNFSLPFVVAIVVAVWQVVNEIISILENIKDIGVEIPPFLLPLMKNVRTKIEDTAQVDEEEGEEEDVTD